MSFKDSIDQRLLSLELALSRLTALLQGIPLLRRLHRAVSAEIGLTRAGAGLGILVDFRSPYLWRPVRVARSQVGEQEGDRFVPAAFRLFDWHTWKHIDGRAAWRGSLRTGSESGGEESVLGFSYEVRLPSPPPSTLGLRLAEGVEGHVRLFDGDTLRTTRFQPQYWVIEPLLDAGRITAIRDTELAMLIVSLSELGSDDPGTHAKAVDRLEHWARFKLQKRGGERVLLELLAGIRDWGPGGMSPMFQGIAEVLERLKIRDQERVLFDFYADNWGARNNPAGRALVVKILGSLGTDAALATLRSIAGYVENRAMPPEELALIARTLGEMEGIAGTASSAGTEAAVRA